MKFTSDKVMIKNLKKVFCSVKGMLNAKCNIGQA